MNFETPFSPCHITLPTSVHIRPLTPLVINDSKLPYEDEPRPQPNRALSLSSCSAAEEEEEEDEEEENEIEIEDDLSLDNDSQRPSTPPTPCMSVCHNNNNNNKSDITDSCNTYLNFIEPRPVPPPSYDTLPPGGCPRFPVSAPGFFSDSADSTVAYNDALPPAYKPAIYKIGVVARKIEWINNQDLLPNRSWKYYIVELNSTQLNFYNVPSRHEVEIVNFRSSPLLTQQPITNLDSIFTNADDFQFYRFVKSLGLLDASRDRKRKPLDKSYSLQNAKIGLATDYKKRTNVLRVKVEDEQILLDFSTVQDVINWNLLLNVGKDVALDVADRELPKYRTVPRRRRGRNRDQNGNGSHGSSSSSNHNHNHNGHNSHSSSSFLNTIHHTGSFARLRSVSDPNKFKGRFSRLRSKLSGHNKNIVSPLPISAISHNTSQFQSVSPSSPSSPSLSRSVSPSPSPSPSPSRSPSTLQSTSVSPVPTTSDTPASASTRPSSDVSRSYSAPNLMDVLTPDETQEASQPDEEEDEEDDYEHDQASINSTDNMNEEDLIASYSYKWYPTQKKFDLRKYHRDCLRCIKPLYYS